ncbi:hypothetical protein [Algoriphagus marinus]|uniref:hypothetical protein n=1 Tax=Algoriphagus marinus TaxID=1925762 RepID=UPI00094BC58F|nr:hypothetical protein [Algoriphagus marinus]
MKTIEIIDKEQISNFQFSKKEVLLTPDDLKRRFADLQRAQTLGNLLQSKVKLIFETADSRIFQVETTIWAVGNDFISLKGGMVIPINAIHKVD